MATTENLITEIKTEKEMEALERAIEKAIGEAMKMAETEDGGTCNFDECLLNVKIPKRLAQRSSCKLRKRDWGYYRGAYQSDVLPVYGQGNRRTRMAEAACKSLRKSGYSAIMYYAMD